MLRLLFRHSHSWKKMIIYLGVGCFYRISMKIEKILKHIFILKYMNDIYQNKKLISATQAGYRDIVRVASEDDSEIRHHHFDLLRQTCSHF